MTDWILTAVLGSLGAALGARMAWTHHRMQRAAHASPPALITGYISVLYDSNRPNLVKIVPSRKPLVTPLEKLYTLACPNVEAELAGVYKDLQGVREAGSWYNRDAVVMYFDHRMGQA